MCGITGYFSDSMTISGNMFYEAHKLIKHRGPDDEGFSIINEKNEIKLYKGDDTIEFFQNLSHISTLSSSKCIIGHRRLSIIDLSEKGHQPFISDNGNYIIVYNGEIYNYKDIKGQLINKGYRFHSDTDTEVVLNSYIEWGESCFSKFNGMWALAIYDLKRNRLVLSRDRFGIKPLYYSYKEGVFCFGSEIKFIRAIIPSLNNVDELIVYDYLKKSHLNSSEKTFFKGIKELEPAHILILEKDRIDIKKYWNFKPKLLITDVDEATEMFTNLFEDSIKLCLQADVEVGSLLSGGLDSNLIVGTMRKLGYSPQAFSAVFEDEKFSEKKYIQESVIKNHLKAHYIYPDPQKIKNDLSRIIYFMEQPLRSLAVYSSFCIYDEIQNTPVKVVLNGQGADELFGGYTYDYYVFFAELFSKGLFKKFKKEYTLFLEKRNPQLNYFFKSMMKLLPKALLKPNFFSSYNLYEITKTPLREYLLYDDRNSMAHGIEVRVPFLDYRLVEFALCLASNLKIDNFVNKRIERLGAKDIVSDSIINREDKMGFVSPQEIWQRKELKAELDEAFLADRLSAIRSVPVPPLIKSYEQYITKKSMDWSKIWRIYCLYRWELIFNN